MNTMRSRIEKIEEALGRAESESGERLAEMFSAQLVDLTDAELDRLEALIHRIEDISGDQEHRVPAPEGIEHLRDFIAFVDADEDAYFAEVARVFAADNGASRYQSEAS